jgi:hypothetical protein
MEVFIKKEQLSSYSTYPAPKNIDGYHVVEMTEEEIDLIPAHFEFNPTSMSFDVNLLKKTLSLRKNEYPSIEDQLDDLYHNGYDGWKSSIMAVKDKYPKE